MTQKHDKHSFSFQLNTGMSEPVSNMPWGLIDGIQIHTDSSGRPFTLFDLLAGAQMEQLLEGLRHQANDNIMALRTLFALELELKDAETPDTWDDMDTLFRVWVRDLIMAEDKKVTPEYKARWEDMG